MSEPPFDQAEFDQAKFDQGQFDQPQFDQAQLAQNNIDERRMVSRRRSRNWVIGLWASVPVALLIGIGAASDENIDSAVQGAYFGYLLVLAVLFAAVLFSMIHVFRFTSAGQNYSSWFVMAAIPPFVTAGILPVWRWTVCRFGDSGCGLDLERMSWVVDRYPDQFVFVFFFQWLPAILVGSVVIQVLLRSVMTFNSWYSRKVPRRTLWGLIALAAASYSAISIEVAYLSDLNQPGPFADGSLYFVIGMVLMVLSLRLPKPRPIDAAVAVHQ